MQEIGVLSMNYVVFMLLLFLGCIVSVALAVFFSKLSREAKYIKLEIARAANFQEKEFWKRELRALYLSVIPGVSIDRARKIASRCQK